MGSHHQDRYLRCGRHSHQVRPRGTYPSSVWSRLGPAEHMQTVLEDQRAGLRVSIPDGKTNWTGSVHQKLHLRAQAGWLLHALRASDNVARQDGPIRRKRAYHKKAAFVQNRHSQPDRQTFSLGPAILRRPGQQRHGCSKLPRCRHRAQKHIYHQPERATAPLRVEAVPNLV